MKTIIAILVAAVLFTSCSNGQSSTPSTVDTSKVKVDTSSRMTTTATAVDTTKH